MESRARGQRAARGSEVWTSLAAGLLVSAVAFLAYVPVLDGEFLPIDDSPFIVDNPAVHRLDLAQAVRCFTDPSTLATYHWRGTYRPLRTLEFCIDWAVSGGRPWFFHLRNVLYHVLASLLCLALFRRLSRGLPGGALMGALIFAVHPVQTEAVAFITSRADTMLAVTFLGALLLHISGRPIAASLMLVLALFSKETAVVFPAAALLVDHCRRAPLSIRRYVLYSAIVGGYLLLWVLIQHHGPGLEGFGHRGVWWGGSYGASLLTSARALLYYAGAVILPVRQVFDYIVTTITGFDVGATMGILIALFGIVGAWRGGRHVRFALLWSVLTLLPVMNIFFTVGTPATERFLYLPMVGICFLGGHIFAWSGRARVPLVCLFALTISRSCEWRDYTRLMQSSREAAVTQLGHSDLAARELAAARAASARRDRENMIRHGEATVRAADELLDDFAKRLGVPPAGPILITKWYALDLLGRDEEALAVAEQAISQHRDALCHSLAAGSLEKLNREEQGARHVEQAIELLVERQGDIRSLQIIAARLLNAAARKRLAAGQTEAARKLYFRSLKALPNRTLNREAADRLSH